MKHLVVTIAIAVSAAVAVPRSQWEASAMLIRSGMHLIELGLALAAPRRPAAEDEPEPDASLDDATLSEA